MRNRFIDSLLATARADAAITLVTADMGFSVLEKFQQELPNQFLNSGISEANTVSLCAGMAMAGRKPYAYSIASFMTLRCLEQIRVDVCYPGLDVKIVGVGGGLDYGAAGGTHYAVEDIAILRALGGMSVVCPADPAEAAALPPLLAKLAQPVYVRLGRGKEPAVHSGPVKMELGKGFRLTEGNGGMVVLATGSITYNALQAVKALNAEGASIRLVSMPWVKPIDEKFLLNELKGAKRVVTVEEHSRVGGLRGAVMEFLSDHKLALPVHPIALPDKFEKAIGSSEFLRKKNGLDAPAIQKSLQAIDRGKD